MFSAKCEHLEVCSWPFNTHKIAQVCNNQGNIERQGAVCHLHQECPPPQSINFALPKPSSFTCVKSKRQTEHGAPQIFSRTVLARLKAFRNPDRYREKTFGLFSKFNVHAFPHSSIWTAVYLGDTSKDLPVAGRLIS